MPVKKRLHQRAGVAVYRRIPHNAAVKITNLFVALALSLSLIACSGPLDPLSFAATAIDDPVGAPAASPRLSGGPGDDLIMSWLQADGDSVALRYSYYQDGRWSDAVTVIETKYMFVNWADLPSVVPLGDGHLAAHWLQRTEGEWYSYDTVFRQSFDNGVTWSSSLVPHADGTPTEHGFVSIFPINGGAGLVWLDGRKMLNEVTDDPTSSGMTLRAAVVDADQAVQSEQVVDNLICDCCQTDVAIAASGPVIVYRDRSPDEIRDIYVTRFLDGQWQPGKPLANDGWEIAGCPVNGPSIVANGNSVAIAWFTSAEYPLVQVAISDNSGESFSEPIEIVRNETLGRVAVALLDNGEFAISWLESASPTYSSVNVRRVKNDSTLGPIRVVADTASGLSVPQMVRVETELVIAWTEKREDGAYIASASVAIDSL